MTSRNKDVSIKGMLENHADGNGFTTIDCILEIIDNAIAVLGVQFVKLTHDRLQNILYVANDGNGVTRDELIDIHRMCTRKKASNLCPGKFGAGYPIARAYLSKNEGLFTWISCHKEPKVDADNIFKGGHHAQACLDLTRSIKNDILELDYAHEMSRSHEEIWTEYAVHERRTGSLLCFPLTPEINKELYELIHNTDITRNLLYKIADSYRDSIKKGLIIKVDDFQIPLLPDIREIVTNPRCHSDVTLIPYRKTIHAWVEKERGTLKQVSKWIIKRENKYYVAHIKIQSNGKERPQVKLLKPNEYKKLMPYEELAEIKVESTYLSSVEEILNKYKPIFEDMGIKVPDESSKITSTPFWHTIISDLVIRSGKRVSLPSRSRTTKTYHEKDKFYMMTSNCYKTQTNDTVDQEWGIQINKNKLHLNCINKDLDLTMRLLTWSKLSGMNAHAFDCNYEQPRLLAKGNEIKAQKEKDAATAAAVTAIKAHASADEADSVADGEEVSGGETSEEEVSGGETSEEEVSGGETSEEEVSGGETSEEEVSIHNSGGSHTIPEYEAHNGLCQDQFMKCLDFLEKLSETQHKHALPTLQNILRKNSAAVFGVGASLQDDYTQFFHKINLNLKQCIDGLRLLIKDKPRPAGGAEIDRLVKELAI